MSYFSYPFFIKTRIFHVFVLIVLIACAQYANSAPNIILIMSDGHAVRAISCYDSALTSTHNVDKIAARGMRFRNCFCTNSLYALSRASILTGKCSHLNGVIDNREVFDSSQQTLK
jgi:arylsulfatase A-like enzyme